MLLKAVQRNMGATVMPRGMATPIHASDIVCVPFDEPIETTVGFAWLPGVSLSRTAMEFVDFVCTSYNE